MVLFHKFIIQTMVPCSHPVDHMPALDTGISPADMFTKTRWEQQKFHDVHVWGCLVYVLDETLSDGKKLPRWTPCSRRASHMGNSTKHASTVLLVLNPETSTITAQFHVMFDDWFATVTSTENELPNLNSDEWKHMFGESTYQHPLDDDDGANDNEFLGLEPLTSSHSSHFSPAKGSLSRRENVARAINTARPPVPLPVEQSPVADSDTSPLLPRAAAPIHDDTPAPAPAPAPAMHVVSMPVAPTVCTRETSPLQVEQSPPMREMSQPREQLNQQQSSPRRESTVELPTRANQQPVSTPIHHSTRECKSHAPRYGYNGMQGSGYHTQIEWDLLQTMYNFNGLPASIFKASLSDPDTLNFDEAMHDTEFKDQWKKAMESEIKSLEEHGTWVEVPILDAKAKILPLTWVIYVRINIYLYNIRFLIRLNDRKGLARASFNTPTHRQWRF